MKIDILTLFPGMFKGVFDESILRIAREKGKCTINIHDLREWTYDRHRTADDKPFGGGPGMVMKVEPVDRGLTDIKKEAAPGIKPAVILLTPQGERLDQKLAGELSFQEHIILVCGHYEGVDERIRDLVDMEISIGDYILTCGEIPAMALCDVVVRLIPGVLGAGESLKEESFEDDRLEYPQYTRPSEYNRMKVPEVLLCGDPGKIEAWRKEQALERTRQRRPDLLAAGCQGPEGKGEKRKQEMSREN
ncbi:MAG: tRNA (guanosine(37)-N1)-methyltransferase TrmD [Candidatus Omnitrophica bacterium]|nr:tRNA (guanosine(37)-N1)-methyltransferase TrmD [Candidatus Omnitrophota bacterium]